MKSIMRQGRGFHNHWGRDFHREFSDRCYPAWVRVAMGLQLSEAFATPAAHGAFPFSWAFRRRWESALAPLHFLMKESYPLFLMPFSIQSGFEMGKTF